MGQQQNQLHGVADTLPKSFLNGEKVIFQKFGVTVVSESSKRWLGKRGVIDVEFFAFYSEWEGKLVRIARRELKEFQIKEGLVKSILKAYIKRKKERAEELLNTGGSMMCLAMKLQEDLDNETNSN
jgi:hypothetical protein